MRIAVLILVTLVVFGCKKKEDEPIKRVLSDFSWTCTGDVNGGIFKLYVNESLYAEQINSTGKIYEGSIGEFSFQKSKSNDKINFVISKSGSTVYQYSDSTSRIIIKKFFIK